MASTTRNIFTLGEYNDDTLAGEGVPLPSVWAGDTRFVDGRAKLPSNMYFTGGNGYQPGYPSSLPERTSYADKINITTDTNSVVPSAQLPWNMGGDDGFNTPSTTISYYAGYQKSRVYKLTYATEAQSSSPTGTFANGPGGGNEFTYMAAVGNDTTGYFAGGDAGSDTSQIQKITFSAETFANLPATGNQPNTRHRQSTVGIPTRGYFVGGMHSGSSTSRATRMEYSTDTTTAIPNANESYFSRGSTGNDIAGYFTGGTSGPHNGFTGGESPTDKLTYATETFEVIPALAGSPNGLPSYWGPGERRGVSGSGDKESGYFAGGLYPAPGTSGDMRSWVDKIDFATDTASRRLTNIQNDRAVGHMGTGARKNGLATFDPPTPTPTPTKSPGDAFNEAIWMGGFNALTNQYTSSGGKIDFSTDAISNLPTTQLTKQSYDLAATSSPHAGYYAQGAPSNTHIVKVDYATSSPSTLTSNLSGGPGGPGNDPRRRGASFGLKTAGYFMQGDTGSSGNLSNLDKITYSSDTSARLPASGTPTGSYATVGASNQTAGYQTGGTPGGGTMRKMPFATESWGNAPGGNFPEMWDAKSMSNATHGYFIGGSGNANGTRVYKLTFATDSTSQLPTNFPQYSRYGWGTGNSTYGYASGGVSTGSITTRIYKLQYSNDTWSTTPNRIQGGAIQQNAAASARQNGNGDTASNMVPNNF